VGAKPCARNRARETAPPVQGRNKFAWFAHAPEVRFFRRSVSNATPDTYRAT
jgi:hypothetical protein